MKSASRIIGLMSGTSLDGLDICYSYFCKTAEEYSFEIIQAETFSYSDEWKAKLKGAFDLDKSALANLDVAYGVYTAKLVNHFILKYNLKGKVDYIGSHGQTVFHQPDKGITLQIGSGEEIANLTKIPVINDFRIKDVKLGGQGAPLVPIGDVHLFGEYQACLNLGGIANISFDKEGERIAFDICPANLALNKICSEAFGVAYDKGGEIAQTGKPIAELLEKLDSLAFYKLSYPKSLGFEWMNDSFYPVLDNYKDVPRADLLASLVVHEVGQIAAVIDEFDLNSVLVTGGGAFNSFFVNQLMSKTNANIIIPTKQIIDFKEALIFGFITFLNIENQVNTLSSVTGASQDSIGGVRHFTDSK